MANGLDTEVLGQNIFQSDIINNMTLIGMIAMALNSNHQAESLKISIVPSRRTKSQST